MSSNAYGVPLARDKGRRPGGVKLFAAAIVMSCLPFSGAGADPVTMLALGDSLTAGYGLDQGKGFVPQLQTWLRENGQDVSLVNAGVSGDTTAGGLARLDWSLSNDVDVVIVNLGGNDMLRGLPPSETRRNLTAIMENLNGRKLPSILIRVPGSLNFGPEDKAAYDAIFPDLADQHDALFIPNFFAALEARAEEGGAMQKLMQPDGLHPTEHGVSLIVDHVGPKILDWMSSRPNPD